MSKFYEEVIALVFIGVSLALLILVILGFSRKNNRRRQENEILVIVLYENDELKNYKFNDYETYDEDYDYFKVFFEGKKTLNFNKNYIVMWWVEKLGNTQGGNEL